MRPTAGDGVAPGGRAVTRGWPLTVGLVVALVGWGLAVRGGGGDPAGLGVPALLFPDAGAPAAASPDAAARAERRLRAFLADGGSADSIVLDEAEVGAVIRERLRGRLPQGVSELQVELLGPRAAVSARLRFDRLETGGQAPHRLSQFLGDSARVEVEVEPSVVAPGRGRVTLRSLRAGGFSLPSGVLPFVLDQIGVETVGGGGDPAVSVPLPTAIGSIEVRDRGVVLRRADGR